MRSLILSALLVGIVSAQSLAGLPTCAYTCVINSIPASCNLNPACICSATSFIAGVTCCVSKVCSEADQLATLKYAKGICTPAGVTLTQTAAICTSTANSTVSSTSKSTSTKSSVSSSVLTSTSSLRSSVSSSLSSVISSASSVASSAASSASAAATSAAGAGRMLVQRGGDIFAAVVAAAAIL